MSCRKADPGYHILRIPVRVTKEEHAALKALCTDKRITRSVLFEAFIADVTQGCRGCGVDFEWWLETRAFGHPSLSCYGRGESDETVSEKELRRRQKWLWSWQEKVWLERRGRA